MKVFSASPYEMVASLWRHRSLIIASVNREVHGRYRGSMFGIFWAFLTPLLMLCVYTFVFSEVFKMRWSADAQSKTEFAMVLFAGLMAFNLFAECINRAPSLILVNVNFVKKVVYPLEILPLVVLAAGLFHFFISLGVWTLAYILLFSVPHLTIIYVPLVLMPLMMFILGGSWMLSSLGVYLRDISQLIGLLVTILMFLSPIFYPVSALPERYQFILYMNPLTPIIEQLRGVLYLGQAPNFIVLGLSWLVNAVIAWLGFLCFQKTRSGFADVL
jgi:lipopolysaccharide transport system permease protein